MKILKIHTTSDTEGFSRVTVDCIKKGKQITYFFENQNEFRWWLYEVDYKFKVKTLFYCYVAMIIFIAVFLLLNGLNYIWSINNLYATLWN